MWDFRFFEALGLMVRTAPFILLRVLVYFGIAVAYVLATGAGAGIGYGIGAFGDEGFRSNATTIGAFVGIGGVSAALYLLREYILYVVKAGHIAVLVELIDGRELPQGRGQIAHASAIVKERFAEASLLFAVDLLIKGVIGAITGLIRGVFTLLPIPGVQTVMRLLHAFLRIAAGFIDEVILAYIIRTKAENAWEAARVALVLYGQNYKTMLKNAAFLTVIVYAVSFAVFFLVLAPAAGVVYFIPGAWSAGGFVFALLFAWAFKAALLEPLAIACMLQVYFKAIEGQEPDPEWDARLASLSSKFGKIRDHALSSIGGALPGGAAQKA